MSFFVLLVLVGVGVFFYFKYKEDEKKKIEQDRKRRELKETAKKRKMVGDQLRDIISGTAGFMDVDLSGISPFEKTKDTVQKYLKIVADTITVRQYAEPDTISLGVRLANLAGRDELLRERAEVVAYVNREKKWPGHMTPYDLQMRLEAVDPRLKVYQQASEISWPVLQRQSHRDRHTYIIGKSGSGKTNLIVTMMLQDFESGAGLAFLAPEHETIEEEILPFVPEERLEDIIYFNPTDHRCKYSFNPLHREPDEDLDLKVEQTFTTFSRLLEGDSSPRINQIIRQILYALIELPDTTLNDIPRLLDRENDHYRNQVIARVKDERTVNFWRTVYPQFPKNAHLPILSRLSQFIRPKRIRNVLCRPERGINIREIMDTGKILLCNLSDGLLGEQTSRLLGMFLMSEIQLATMSRADTLKKDRRRFYVYLDEFQSFTGGSSASYEKLLSRARKYHLPLILAHQQTGQIPPQLLKEIFGNVSTMVSFLVSHDDAVKISREFILDDDPDGKHMSPDKLVTQDIGIAYIKMGNYAFQTKTFLKDNKPNWDIKKAIIKESQRDTRPQPTNEEQSDEAIPSDPFAQMNPEDLF